MSWFQEDKRTYMQKCFGKLLANGPTPKHVAFIMDGNRRFAKTNKIPKIGGHRSGFDKLAEVCCFMPKAFCAKPFLANTRAFRISKTLIWCYAVRVREVTVYAFSIENFKRSKDEVDELFELAREKFERLYSEK
jgi:ditrans,polycis-polyprenyl diphosphate synthase